MYSHVLIKVTFIIPFALVKVTSDGYFFLTVVGRRSTLALAKLAVVDTVLAQTSDACSH